MRYIGSKAPVIDFLDKQIVSVVDQIRDKTFADLFAGTVVVSKHFKRLGCKLITNDYLAFSFVLQSAYIRINRKPAFADLKPHLNGYEEVLAELNSLPPREGFFFNNYCTEGTKTKEYQRNYFSAENARKIDSIMTKIHEWKTRKLISEEEDYPLRASLLDAVTRVSNISGTYGAFLKSDDPRKYKPLQLEPIEFIESSHEHACYNADIFKIIDGVSGDILYLDPPYNTRQYPPYYHILETVSLNDDPPIYGKTGRRPYSDKLSPFSMRTSVKGALFDIVRRANFEHIFLSYNTDSLLSTDDILKLLGVFGAPQIFFQDHRRYKSNSNGDQKGRLREVLFYVRKEHD